MSSIVFRIRAYFFETMWLPGLLLNADQVSEAYSIACRAQDGHSWICTDSAGWWQSSSGLGQREWANQSTHKGQRRLLLFNFFHHNCDWTDNKFSNS
jgi:hypothetical protein